MMKNLTILFIVILVLGCSKEKQITPIQDIEPIDQWKKFIGNYKVYDTVGNYMYNMEIAHYSTTPYPNGHKLDSLIIINFADTFDLKFAYSLNSSGYENYLDIGFNDSVVDYNAKMWWVGRISDDTSTVVKENRLINDTIILYFEQDNIKFYINEAQPYYRCECKHVAVKQ
jgi:hypothetical protein